MEVSSHHSTTEILHTLWDFSCWSSCSFLDFFNCSFKIVSISSQPDSARFGMTAVPLYTRSKQARGYKAFTRQSCPTFPLCASAAGLGCIIHEHSVNLLIRNMCSLFLCLIYCLSFSHSAIFPSSSLAVFYQQANCRR